MRQRLRHQFAARGQLQIELVEFRFRVLQLLGALRHPVVAQVDLVLGCLVNILFGAQRLRVDIEEGGFHLGRTFFCRNAPLRQGKALLVQPVDAVAVLIGELKLPVLRFRLFLQGFDFALQKRVQVRQRLELKCITLGPRFHQRAFAGEKRVDLGDLFHLRRLGNRLIALYLGDQPRLAGKQPCPLVIINGGITTCIDEVAGKTLSGVGPPQAACKTDSLQHGDVRGIGIFTRCLHIATQKDRPELGDLYGGRRQVAEGELALKLSADLVAHLGRSLACDVELTDEGQGQRTGWPDGIVAVDDVPVADAAVGRLPFGNADTQFVRGTELILSAIRSHCGKRRGKSDGSSKNEGHKRAVGGGKAVHRETPC